MKAVLVLGGDRPEPGAVMRETADAGLVLGVDRGAAYLMDEGVLPHRVVGDMDSLDGETLQLLRSREVPMDIHPSCKDETDGQIAVDLALGQGVREVVLLGADGGRPDHAAANYHIMLRAARAGAAVRMAARWGEALVTGPASVQLRGRPGCVVSILPMGEELAVGRTENLAYDVGPPLYAGQTRGVSNSMTADRARVEILSGWALIFILNKG